MKELHEIQAIYKKNEKVKETRIRESNDVSNFIKDIYPIDINHREAMLVLFLNKHNITTGYSVVSIGGISGTIADQRIIFQMALLNNASGIILIHNHPSGNLNPSKADLNVTGKIKKTGEFLDIKLLDHLIITEESYFSFADRGKM